MKTNILMTLALIMTMMLTGCSKEDSENMEQTNALLKEQIVGVWRNGDYWVSFSEDGFYSAFFYIDDRERIDDGGYTIEGDVVTIKNPEHTTKNTIKSVSETAMTLVMEYTYPNRSPRFAVFEEMNFTKVSDIPCKENDDLVGKSFSYDDSSETHNGKVITWTNYILHNDRIINTVYSEPNRWGNSYCQQYYVYLPPFIYHTTLFGSIYDRDESVLQIGKITILEDGTISYKKER